MEFLSHRRPVSEIPSYNAHDPFPPPSYDSDTLTPPGASSRPPATNHPTPPGASSRPPATDPHAPPATDPLTPPATDTHIPIRIQLYPHAIPGPLTNPHTPSPPGANLLLPDASDDPHSYPPPDGPITTPLSPNRLIWPSDPDFHMSPDHRTNTVMSQPNAWSTLISCCCTVCNADSD